VRPRRNPGRQAASDFHMEDIDLMLRVKAGDWLSFAALMDRHRSTIERFLYNKVRNRALAEELAQEVFLRVYRARLNYQPTARFKSWLFQIAAHLASNSRRDRRHERWHESLDTRPEFAIPLQIADARPTVEEALLADCAFGVVRRAVATLPEKQRTAVVLHKFHGAEYAEIALRLGCTESAVKSLMFRAYERLRATLSEPQAA
jgi:RNA polymerase sigma-70 factor, ECF subfamily